MMYSEADSLRLMQSVVATAEVLGQEIKPTTAAVMVNDLESRYPAEVVLRALSDVRSNYAGRLTLKVIVDAIEQGSGRQSANEAWATALGALDERNTLVWTEEMGQAWAAARPIMDLGDKVGARMAFIAAYERLVKISRDEGRPVKWTVSLGWDMDLRKQTLEQAVTAGMLPAPQAMALLPPPEPKPDPAGQVKVAEVLKQLRQELREAPKRRRQEQEAKRQEAIQAERDDIKQRKIKAAARLRAVATPGAA